MFLLDLIRYLRGHVKFRVQGTFIERFLNLAARDRIPIWNGIKRGDAFTGNTLASSYHKLRRHARKTGVKMCVVEKHGAPFKRRKYRKRTGLLIGLGIFFTFIFAMSRFIWRIEINGNERVSESEVIAALEKIGVAPGRLRSSIDVRGAERRALLALDDLSWIALNIKGSAVHVEIRESDPKPPMIDPNMPSNVVAARSGQILSMVVYDGQTLKTIGDSVLEGDIIVSGITEDRLGQNLFKHARAKIEARVQHRITIDMSFDQIEFRETGEVRNRYYLRVFDWDLPLFWPRKIPGPYYAERESKLVTFAGTEVPIGIFSEKYHLMKEELVTHTEEEAKLMALKELSLRQAIELEGAEILDKTATGAVNDKVFTVIADYVCIMDIAKEKQIYISK